MRIRWKLPLALVLTTLVVVGIAALVSTSVLRGAVVDGLQDDMSRQARQLVAALTFGPEPAPGSSLPVQDLLRRAGEEGGARFILLDREGHVLAASEGDPASLGDQSSRPEVVQALAGNEGRAIRLSDSLDREEAYVAVPLPENAAPWSQGALSMAVSTDQVAGIVSAAWRVPLIVWAILLLPVLILAHVINRSITHPLKRLRHMTSRVASGDLEYRTSVRGEDELGELADSLNAMAAQLESRAEQLRVEMERSARVFGAMSEGVLLIDSEGRLLRCNPAAEAILEAKLAGMEGSPFVFAARAFPARLLAQKARESGGALTEVVELAAERTLAVEVIPLEEAGEGGAHTLFVMRDETARRAVEAMRRDFATNVSHELKTPLAGLTLLAETLRHAVEEDPAQARRFLDRLSTEIKRLVDLTSDLLTLSRLEESDVSPAADFVATDLSELAGGVASELEPLAEAKNQSLGRLLAQRAPVIGDEVALRTMIRNLLDNAVRYTDEGGRIELSVQVEHEADGTPWAVLAVRDNGVGIPHGDRQRVFERFYRVDKARSRETGGTGLGLSIVRHVAERHGGRVELESTLGVGSTFTVRIPAA